MSGFLDSRGALRAAGAGEFEGVEGFGLDVPPAGAAATAPSPAAGGGESKAVEGPAPELLVDLALGLGVRALARAEPSIAARPSPLVSAGMGILTVVGAFMGISQSSQLFVEVLLVLLVECEARYQQKSG